MANNDFLDEFAKMIWGKRSEGLPVPELDLKREISPQELLNIYQKSAFVQILNTESEGEFSEIRFVRSRSGWVIMNYKDAMTASPRELLYKHGDYVVGQDGTLERICSGKGTIVLQIMNTAADMVRIAKNEEHWPSIHIVSGHPLMSWGIWKAAKDLDIGITGYVPSKKEEEKYQRIQRNCQKLIEQPSPPTAAPAA